MWKTVKHDINSELGFSSRAVERKGRGRRMQGGCQADDQEHGTSMVILQTTPRNQ